MQFVLTKQYGVLDKSHRRLAEHHPSWRRQRLHPLRHPDLLAHGGVISAAGTDFACDDLSRVQPDPQSQLDAVAVEYLGRQTGRLVLDFQGGDARTNRVILEGHRRTEHRHDPVAGEFVDGSSVLPHHCRRSVEQLGHELAKSLRTHRRGDVHRLHHVGEQNGHLLVLGERAWLRDGRAAGVAEPGVGTQLDAAGAAAVAHINIVAVTGARACAFAHNSAACRVQTLSVRLDCAALRWLGFFPSDVWLLQTLPSSGWHSSVVPTSGGKDRPA